MFLKQKGRPFQTPLMKQGKVSFIFSSTVILFRNLAEQRKVKIELKNTKKGSE